MATDPAGVGQTAPHVVLGCPLYSASSTLAFPCLFLHTAQLVFFFCGCHTLPSPFSENPSKASLPVSLARLDAVVGNCFPLGMGPLTVSPEINLAGL